MAFGLGAGPTKKGSFWREPRHAKFLRDPWASPGWLRGSPGAFPSHLRLPFRVGLLPSWGFSEHPNVCSVCFSCLNDPQLVLMFVTKNPESSSEGRP